MDHAGDRTVMVAAIQSDDANATAIGTSPFAQGGPAADTTAPAGRQIRPSAPISGNSATHESLKAAPSRPSGGVKSLRDLPVDETIVPQARRSLVDEDTGNHDLAPIEATGFRPALEVDAEAGTGPQGSLDSTIPPRSAKPKIVIGDAPVGGATSIGPSPFAPGNETRMYKDPSGDDGEEAQEQQEENDDEQGYEDEQGEEAEEAAEDEVADEQDEPDDQQDATGERPAIPARPVRPVQPPKKPTQQLKAQAKPAGDNKRKGLLIAIVATAALALIVIVAAALKFTGGGSKSTVVIVATPKDVPYTVLINPGELRIDKPGKAIELEPGEYTFEFKPTVPNYLSDKKRLAVKPGKPASLSVTFQRASAEPEPTPEPPKQDPPPTTPEPAVPTLWQAVITTDEPGVEIFLDGKSRGTAPVTVKDLAVGKSYDFTAKKAGFETKAFTVSNGEKKEQVETSLVMTKLAKPEPAPKADPPPKPEPVVKADPPPRKDPPPKADPPPRADPPPKKDPPRARVMGKVAFASSPMGAEVWVDGKSTGRKTPVPQASALEFPVGKHKVVFKAEGKSSAPMEFEVTEANKDKPLVVKGAL
jgi:hypothetical protein